MAQCKRRITDRTPKKRKITSKPVDLLFFVFPKSELLFDSISSIPFLRACCWPSSARQGTRCSCNPHSDTHQNKERTPNLGLLQEILDTRSSAVGTLQLVLPLASTCPAAPTRTSANRRQLAAQHRREETEKPALPHPDRPDSLEENPPPATKPPTRNKQPPGEHRSISNARR